MVLWSGSSPVMCCVKVNSPLCAKNYSAMKQGNSTDSSQVCSGVREVLERTRQKGPSNPRAWRQIGSLMATNRSLGYCYHLKEDGPAYGKPSGPSALSITRAPSELKHTGASAHCKEMPRSPPLGSLPLRLILDFAMCSKDTSRRSYPSRPVETFRSSSATQELCSQLRETPRCTKDPKYHLLLTHSSSGYQGLTEATENHTLSAS